MEIYFLYDVISHVVICQLFLTLIRVCNHQLFSHTKTAAIYPRKHLGLIVWREWAQGPCDVCHAYLSPSCTPPSLFIIGPRHASGICGIFPSLYISTTNLTNFSHVRQCRLCGLSALQSDRQNKRSLNQFIYGYGKLEEKKNWEFPYGLWWNDKILSTGLWGSNWWNYQVSKRDLPSAWQFNYPSVSLSCWVIILNRMRWNGLSS